MVEMILGVMLVSAVLYAVFAGADFGLGMIEPWLGKDAAQAVDRALSPIWEANHVWLILLVVLAFVAFPPVFYTLSLSLHLPLLIALLGIVARGTAFTFRHYDPDPAQLRAAYSLFFRAGSFLTPLALGVCLAAWVQGSLTADVSRGFYAAFIAPWNTPFCWLSGLFVCSLFAFQGAALLAAEQAEQRAEGPSSAPLPHLTLARRLHALAITSGALALAAAYWAELRWLQAFLSRPLSLVALVAATLLAPLSALAFARGAPWLLRLSVGGQVGAVLLGLFGAQAPVLLSTRESVFTIANASAPAATLRAMNVALVSGLVLIVPSLIYLWRVYKSPGAAREQNIRSAGATSHRT
jgi:cytochrome bd ubiquinol oxidase subunit II